MNFLGRPVFDVYPDFVNPKVGQLDDQELVQRGVGIATPWKSTTVVKRKLTLPFLFETKADWRVFRDLISDAGGSLTGFWVPLWVTDYPATAHLITTSQIVMEAIGLADVFVAGEQYAFVALINHGSIECFQINSIDTSTPGSEILMLDSAIVGSFDPASTVCCGLLYARVAEDGIRHQFLTNEVVRTTVEFVELPQEYGTASEGEKPAFLYEVTRSDKVWRLTNYPSLLVVDSEAWAPDNVEHGEIRSGIEFLAEGIDLNFGTELATHPARYAIQRNAMEAVDVRIFETDTDLLTLDEDAPIYVGRTGQTKFNEKSKIDIQVSSILRIAELQIPRMQVQRTCNHRLYDVNCGVNPGTYDITGTLTDVQSGYVEAAAFGTEATAQGDAQWFALGKVTVGNEVRLITGQVANKLYLSQSFLEAAIGDSATALPGCNKRISHCDGRYNNLLGTVQFPYIPGSNPQFEALTTPKPSGGKKS